MLSRLGTRWRQSVISRSLSRVDHDLIYFVDDAVKNLVRKNVPEIPHWGTIELDGAVGTLKRIHNDESHIIRFNINGSLPSRAEHEVAKKAGKEFSR